MNKIFETYIKTINEANLIKLDDPVNGISYLEIDTSKKVIGVKTDNWSNSEIKAFIKDQDDDRFWDNLDKAISGKLKIKQWGDVIDGSRRTHYIPAIFEPGEFDFLVTYD